MSLQNRFTTQLEEIQHNTLVEIREALHNVFRVKCFTSGHSPCQCTLCKVGRVIDLVDTPKEGAANA